jgi:hypothetical protein
MLLLLLLTGYTVPPITRPKGYQVRSSNLRRAAAADRHKQ